MSITRVKLWPVFYFKEKETPEVAYFHSAHEAAEFRRQDGVLDTDLGETTAFFDSESGQYYEQGPPLEVREDMTNDFLTRCTNTDCPMRESCVRFITEGQIELGGYFKLKTFQFETVDTDTLPIALTGLMEACGYQNLRAARCDHYIEKDEDEDDD